MVLGSPRAVKSHRGIGGVSIRKRAVARPPESALLDRLTFLRGRKEVTRLPATLRSASSLLRQPETERSRLKLNATTSAQWTYSSVSKAGLHKTGVFLDSAGDFREFWPKSANAGLRRLSWIRKARIWWAFLVKKTKFSKKQEWVADQEGIELRHSQLWPLKCRENFGSSASFPAPETFRPSGGRFGRLGDADNIVGWPF